MTITDIAQRFVERYVAVVKWLVIGTLWLIVLLFLTVAASACLEEIGTRPTWALGNLWGAYLIGTTVLIVLTWAFKSTAKGWFLGTPKKFGE